jgi:uncharacterized protein (TIGR03435 family)
MNREEQNVARWLKKSLPSTEETKSAGKRVFDRLLSAEAQETRTHSPYPRAENRSASVWRFAVIGALAVFAVLALAATPFVRGLLWPANVYATVLEGAVDQLDGGRILRTGGNAGALVSLPDSSKVEMRSESELSLDRRDDGLRLRLNKGGVIVTAAKQGSGHLYVETKDVIMFVDGTVFLVKAEKGSRIAVIEGEVQVKTGATERKLRPGEQVATSPILQSVPMIDELSWSRNAPALMALLRQPVVVVPPPAQTPSELRIAFEVVSVRPGDVAPQRSGRGGALPFGFGCGGSFLQIDPGRFAVSTNGFTLVALANGMDCVHAAQIGLISGGPSWLASDQFTIQATMPEGTPGYTRHQLLNGQAPKLQKMIQTLLTERFKVTTHHESREMSVYALTIAKGGPKLHPAEEGNCDPTSGPIPAAQRTPGQKPPCVNGFNVNRQGHFNVFMDAATLDSFAQLLGGALQRPVVDRTGINGVFDIRLESSVDDTMFHDAFAADPADNSPSVFDAIQQQFGLKLESTKAPIEVLVIDHAEKPSEN